MGIMEKKTETIGTIGVMSGLYRYYMECIRAIWG